MTHYPPNPYVAAPKKQGVPKWLIALLMIPIVMIVLAGVCAAVAIPALTKSLRKGKGDEARANVEAIFAAANESAAAAGQCPQGRPSGRAGVTPPLDLDCNAADRGRCTPTIDVAEAAQYSLEEWLDNEVWDSIGFSLVEPHSFHYDLTWETDSEGACRFTAFAYGDLDGDGEFSTFEKSGAEIKVTDEAE